jgi:hypothetical protein
MDHAARIELLFSTVTKPDGKEFSHREIEELAGGTVSHAAIWKARKGLTESLSQRMIEALSTAFQIHPGYFSAEHVTAGDIPKFQKQYRSESLVEQIALRAGQLDDEAKEHILNMIDFVRKAQGAHQ